MECYYAETLAGRRALLGSDPHYAQGSVARRSSLDAELACGAAPRRSCGVGVIDRRPALCAELDVYNDLHFVHGVVIWRPSLCADLTWGSACRYGKVARCSSKKLGSFCITCVAVVYFSPRLLCRFDLAVRAISIGRRIASDREGLSFCFMADFSCRPRGR